MEPKKDRLEEYFRKSLESLGDKPSPGGWDLPSEHVWKGIEGGILPVAGAGGVGLKALIVKYSVCAALTASVGYGALQWYNHKQEVKGMQEVIAKQKEAIADLNMSLLEEKVKRQEAENQVATENAISNLYSETKFTESSEVQDLGERVLNHRKVGSSTIKDNLNSDIELKSASAQKNLHIESQINPTLLPAIEEHRVKSTSLTFLEPVKFNLGKSTSKPSLNYSLDLIKPVTGGYRNSLTIGAFASPVYSYRNLYHKGLEVSTPFEKTESPQISYTGGLNVGIPVGRNMSVGTGLYYSVYHLHSFHTIGLRFTNIGGMRDSLGNSVNRYKTKIQTSFGQVELESRVSSNTSNKGLEMNEGRPFPIRYEASMSIRHLTLPMLIQYHIGNERFGVVLKAGLAGSALIGQKLKIQKVSSLNEDLLHLNTKVLNENVLNTTQKFTLDMYASTAFRASLSSRFDLVIEPSFRKNITPVFEDPKLETRMFGLALQTGLTYKF